MACLKLLAADTWPEDAMLFGITIQVSHPPSRQFHTAALYRFGNVLWMGDLQNHLRTCRTKAKPTESIYWLAPDLVEEEQKILAAKIDAWLDTNENKIPYSVASPGGSVFRDDVWVGNEPGQGLTCATFLVELFKELAIPFIDVETWQNRDGDDAWAEKLLTLIGTSMSPIHVNAQRLRIGDSIRVRPTDVAAAGLLVSQEMEVALTFDQVAPTSAWVEAKLLPE